MPSWETILNFVKELGLKDGIFVLFFFLAHAWIYSLYMGRIKDRQREIDRLAKDNREYRNRFIELLDKHWLDKKEDTQGV